MSLYAVILAGGGGTRLWPASRRRRPKQFLPLAPGGRPLLRATIDRLAPLAPPDRVLVATTHSQVAEVRALVPDLPPENLVVEPAPRNTGPAVALAAQAVVRRGEPDAVLAVLPSDHVVTDETAFRAALAQAVAVGARHLGTIGILPTHPETGYGYLALGPPGAGPDAGAAGAARPVERFIEKPDPARAREYLASGRHLWNSGMFFFRADRILEETRRHLPEVAAAVAPGGRYEDAPAISIDYGIMEKASDIWAVEGTFGWNDIGGWAALADVHPADPDGNVRLGGPLVGIDARRNVVFGDALVALVGVEDLVVVAQGDAILVVPRARAQDVRAIAQALEMAALDRFL